MSWDFAVRNRYIAQYKLRSCGDPGAGPCGSRVRPGLRHGAGTAHCALRNLGRRRHRELGLCCSESLHCAVQTAQSRGSGGRPLLPCTTRTAVRRLRIVHCAIYANVTVANRDFAIPNRHIARYKRRSRQNPGAGLRTRRTARAATKHHRANRTSAWHETTARQRPPRPAAEPETRSPRTCGTATAKQARRRSETTCTAASPRSDTTRRPRAPTPVRPRSNGRQ